MNGRLSTPLHCHLLLAVFLAANSSSCSKQETSPNVSPTLDIPKVNASLSFTGSQLDRPTFFTFSQLATMPMTTIRDVPMRTSHEEETTDVWHGPSLSFLLSSAELRPGPAVFTIIADDGYEIEATSKDLQDAIIALKHRDGQWLVRSNEADCTIRLIAPRKPGNFWVADVKEIKIEPPSNSE